MAAPCFDASVETLWPLLSPHAPCRGGSLALPSQGISSGSPGSCDAFGMSCPRKQSTVLLSRVLRSALPESQFSALMNSRRFLHSNSWDVWAFWVGTESCWKTHFWPMKRIILRYFATSCGTSSWYIRTPVSPLSCKNEDVSLPDGTPPNRQWRRKGDGLRMDLKGRLSINLLVLVVILVLHGENFLLCEEEICLPVLCLPLEETLCSCPSDFLKEGVRTCPFERWCALMCRSSLMRHELIGLKCSAFGTWSSVSRVDFGESSPVLFW